jgi:hypothetical protein
MRAGDFKIAHCTLPETGLSGSSLIEPFSGGVAVVQAVSIKKIGVKKISQRIVVSQKLEYTTKRVENNLGQCFPKTFSFGKSFGNGV